MASGAQHYREAEQILRVIASGEHQGNPTALAGLIGVGQIHALLALAAATIHDTIADTLDAYGIDPNGRDDDSDWHDATQPTTQDTP